MTEALHVYPWGGHWEASSKKLLDSSFILPPPKGQIALILLPAASESPRWPVTLSVSGTPIPCVPLLLHSARASYGVSRARALGRWEAEPWAPSSAKAGMGGRAHRARAPAGTP